MQISYLVTAQVEPSDPESDPSPAIRETLVSLLSQDLVSDADGEGYRIVAWGVEPYGDLRS